MPKCRICNCDLDVWQDEPCDVCRGVINEVIQEANEEDIAALDDEYISREFGWQQLEEFEDEETA